MRPREGGDGLGGRARWAWRGLQEAEAELRTGQPRPPTASRRADGLGGPRLWASSRGFGVSAAAPAPEAPVGARVAGGCRDRRCGM